MIALLTLWIAAWGHHWLTILSLQAQPDAICQSVTKDLWCQARTLLRTRWQIRNTPKKIPVAWGHVVSCFNHSELWHVNNMATLVGCCMPFPYVERLPEDNREHFFLVCINCYPFIEGCTKYGIFVCALCKKMSNKTVAFTTAMSPPQMTQPTRTTNDIVVVNGKSTTPQTAQAINNVNSDVTRWHASLPRQPTIRIVNRARNSANRTLFGVSITPLAIAPATPMNSCHCTTVPTTRGKGLHTIHCALSDHSYRLTATPIFHYHRRCFKTSLLAVVLLTDAPFKPMHHTVQAAIKFGGLRQKQRFPLFPA